MMKISVSEMAAACGGKYIGDEDGLSKLITGVTIDSRNVAEGTMFAAIKGANTDGHLYMSSALEKGASCILCERAEEEGRFILVDSTEKALQRAAEYYREKFDIPFIGVTGSVGKTTTKEMISAVLSGGFNVHKTAGNYNNGLGVPLTLFGLESEHTAAVIEMGISDFGEMRVLTKMAKPDYAVFTLIGSAHLEFLHDRNGVLAAKSEIVEGMSENGLVIVNGDDDLLCKADFERAKLSYGLGDHCDLRAVNIVSQGEKTSFDAIMADRKIHIELDAYGEHMIYAALAGIAVGIELGLSDEQISRGISSYEITGSRSRIVDTGFIRIIDDCYNANPSSVASAISSLVRLEGRKVLILGDMLELGENAAALHSEIGCLAAQKGAELLLCTGELSRNTAASFGENARWYDSVESLFAELKKHVLKGDNVLVKASRSMKFERIVEELKKLD